MQNEIHKKNWLFRVAGQKENGGGHIARSLLLSNNMKNAHISFSVSQDSPYRDLIEKNNFPVVSKKNEEKNYYDGIWIDSYQESFDEYRSKTNFLCIIEDHKDLYDKGDLYVRPYAGNFTPRPGKKILEGLRYAPIDPVFFCERVAIRPNVENILVFMGRYDSVNATGQLLSTLNDFDRLPHVHIVMGSTSLHLQENKKFLEDQFRHKYKLDIDLPNLSKALKEADLSIVSGGVAMLESCAAGCPTISLNIAENQFVLSQDLFLRNCILHAGKITDFKPEHFKELFLSTYCFETRQVLSNNCQNIFSKPGIFSIAQTMEELLFHQNDKRKEAI